MKNWYVTYKVKGFDKEFESGPYSVSDLPYHRNDISGFEGVYDVNILQKDSKEKADN